MVNRLALDIGKARIGVAISHSKLAQNYETIYCKTWTKDAQKIAEIVQKEAIEEIVVGLPLNMDGTESEMCEYAKKFCGFLKTKTDCKIVFVDERLSSFEAEEYMHEAGVKTAKKKGIIDQIAGTIILQSYLDCQRGD